MRADLTAILRCPDCGGDLGLEGPEAPAETREDVEEGALECGRCHHEWPIVRGIPRLVPPELAPPLESTGSRFGYEWTAYPDLHDLYREQFLAWIAPARPEDFQGAWVLDAGCGKGRHLHLAHQFGAARAVGVDLGPAVEAARANTRFLDGVDVVQGDLLRMPLKSEFDLAYCVGVLHHLPDPAEGFRAVTSRLVPGGRIHVWVYAHEGNAWIRLLFDPVRRHVLRRLPPPAIRPLAWLVAVPLFALSRTYRAISRRSPGLHSLLFYRDYLTFLGSLHFAEVRHIVFDQMVAPTTHYIRREEIEGWFRETGLEDVAVEFLRGMSWRGSGRVPELRSAAAGEASP